MPNITINNTTLVFNNIYYVSTTGNDITGNGARGTPLASLHKAVNVASSGDAICILRGTYRLTPFYVSGYTSVGVHDLGKNLFICGENEKTILEFYASDISVGTSRDANLFGTIASTTITNLTFNYYPSRSNNYSNAIMVDCALLSLRNCFIENKGTSNWSYRYNNAANARTPVENCVFKSNGKASGDYSGNPIYHNCLFDAEPTLGTKYYCITRTITANDTSRNVPSDLVHAGNTDVGFNNPDGTVNNIGVFGGPLSWGNNYSYNSAVFKNNIYGIYENVNGIKLKLEFHEEALYSFRLKLVDSDGNVVIDYDQYYTILNSIDLFIPLENMKINDRNDYTVYVKNIYEEESSAGIIYIFATKDRFIVYNKCIVFKPTMPVIESNGAVMVSTQGSYKFITSALSTDNKTWTQVPLDKLYQMPQNFRQLKLQLFMSDEAQLKAYGIACI